MGTAVDRKAWRELVDGLVEQKRRLVTFGDHESDTMPKPGASEEQLRAAESRLGRRLDPQYRELLSVANGWDHFWISYSLLGTEDIGSGPRWESGLTQAGIWFDDNDWGDEIGAPNDPASFQLVVENDNGYSGNVFLFVGPASDLPIGAAVPLPPEMTYPDLYSYVRAQLDSMTADADQATLGEYSEPWQGRNLRAAPPTMAEIVAKIGELIQSRNPDRPAPLRAGATVAELDALDRELGGRLHPEHRELLSESNGLATPYWGLGDVLSVQDIRDGVRWREELARKQSDEDYRYDPPAWTAEAAQILASGQQRDKPAPLVERVGYLPTIPFAMSSTTFYGIDITDGCVRDLLQDGEYFTKYGRRPAMGRTVRDHLLKGCRDLWWLSRLRTAGQ
ncbi:MULTISPECIES: SMI1/KNR4 family protein [unclassified Nocardia]|uniref:SMI1/KNR4 family protein n=1 Tax=unclassified Nocardia TaxID=2637762 RepID=UPI00278C1CC0|nr:MULTISPECIES: SMI1/KNR4 family protein [unclassified Nocardia]